MASKPSILKVTQKSTSQTLASIIPRSIELQTQKFVFWLAHTLSCDMTVPYLERGEVLMRYETLFPTTPRNTE